MVSGEEEKSRAAKKTEEEEEKKVEEAKNTTTTIKKRKNEWKKRGTKRTRNKNKSGGVFVLYDCDSTNYEKKERKQRKIWNEEEETSGKDGIKK